MVKFVVYIGVAIACLVGLLGAAGGWILLSTPRPTNIRSCLTTAMFQVRLCPGEAGYVKLSAISPHARNAIIVSEDGDFYGHKGFDWNELRSSFETNLEKGAFHRGGSTITQQLAKNVYLSTEKSLLRKVREALITIQLEDLLSKDEILEKYLNVVEFGPGIFGVAAASRHYFKKTPSELRPSEASFLAFLLPNPKKYSVSFKKKQLTPFARKQVKEIVDRLARYKKISQIDRDEAIAEIESLFGGAPAPAVGEPTGETLDEELDVELNEAPLEEEV